MFLLVFGVGGLGADRAAHAWAMSRAETSLAANGVGGPQVEVGRFPFLTQLLRREFDDVLLRADTIALGEDEVTSVTAEADGVTVEGATDVTVGSLRGNAVVSYESVVEHSGLQGVRLADAGSRVRISGDAVVFGRTLPVTVLARVEAESRAIRLVPDRVELDGGEDLPASLGAALTDRFSVVYRLRSVLPRGVRLTDVSPLRDGLRIRLTGTDVRLSRSS